MNNPSVKTVLVVNDSADQREMMQTIFERAGCRALIASDGSEALQVAKNTRLDLIVSDVMMPCGSGIELCEWIRADEQLRTLPILLISALRKDSGDVVEGLEAGADDYIELPFDPPQLIARAERLIERKRMEDVLRESESYFRSLIENITDIITILSFDGTILYESPSVKQILGFQPGELVGKNAFDFIHHEDLEKVGSYFKNDPEKYGKTARIEYRFRDRTDAWRILESTGKRIEDSSRGSVIIVTSRDITERRLTEKTLRESQSQMQAIFDNAQIGIMLSNLQKIPIRTNPALEKMLGYTGDELRRMSFAEYTHPDDVHLTLPILKEVLEGRRDSFQIDKRYIRKNGEEMWGSLLVSAICGERGEPQFTLAIIEDITERKRAEENISFQAHLLDTVEQAVIATDLDGKVIYWNWFADKIYGWSAAEAAGRNIVELTTPEIMREQAVEIMRQLATGKSWSGEFTVRNKIGETFPIQITNTPVNDDKGALIGIVGISNDITERKQTEQILRESEENFRALVLATTNHVWTIKETDADRDHPQWWLDLTGQTLEEVRSVGWIEAVHPEDRETVHEIWQNAFAGRILFDTSYRVRSKTGEYHHFAVRGVPVFNADGKFRQWIGTFNDITELKRAEEALKKSDEQLRQSQKLESVGRLAGGIAHDFNNMLTAINGHSELALRKLDADSPLRRNVEEIKKAAERSAQLTQQLLAFSRKQVLQSNVLDLNEVVSDTISLLERLIGENVRLETRLGANGRIKGDAGQLTQVVINLAVNARDAMPQGGNVIIETAKVFLDEEFAAAHSPTKPGSYVKLSVSDNGSGMDAETLKSIFEPFFTTKEIGKGTGLGLATVYGIIKQSGGFIWVESEVGAGSRFDVYLPCIDAEPDARTAKKTNESSAKTAASILIVDDEDLVRSMTRQTLEECGYQVFEAGSGAAALSICREMNCRIDLVITDVMMPEMDGRELGARLAELCPQMPVLFTSGYTGNSDGRLNINKINNFIQKPFTFDALASKVKKSLACEN